MHLREAYLPIDPDKFRTSLESGGRTEVRGTLKTKHDTARNSIGNIR